MSFMRIGAAILVAASLSACATITRGTKQKFYVNSDPSGATVEMTNNMHCVTPCKLKINRKSDFTVNIAKPGYEPASFHVQGKVKGGGAAGGLAGNAMIGGPVGLGIDALTGAMLNLRPNPINVKLVPVGSPAPAADAPVAEAPAPEAPAPAAPTPPTAATPN